MGKYPKLEPAAKCVVCSINVYSLDGTIKPQVMPCGIGGPDRRTGKEACDDCPYETSEQRLQIEYSYDTMIKDLHRKPE